MRFFLASIVCSSDANSAATFSFSASPAASAARAATNAASAPSGKAVSASIPRLDSRIQRQLRMPGALVGEYAVVRRLAGDPARLPPPPLTTVAAVFAIPLSHQRQAP